MDFDRTELPQIHFVHVGLEDFVLREALFDECGEDELGDFSFQLFLTGEKDVFDELLCDGGSALGESHASGIGAHGAENPENVEAVVAEKARVLEHDDRLDQQGGHVREIQGLALFHATRGEGSDPTIFARGVFGQHAHGTHLLPFAEPRLNQRRPGSVDVPDPQSQSQKSRESEPEESG